MRKIKHRKVTKRIVALTMMTALMYSNAVFFVSADEPENNNVSQSTDATAASSDNQSGDSSNVGGSTTTDNTVAGDDQNIDGNNTAGGQDTTGTDNGVDSQNTTDGPNTTDSTGTDGQNGTGDAAVGDQQPTNGTDDTALNGSDGTNVVDGQVYVSYPVMTMDTSVFGTTAKYVLNSGNFTLMGGNQTTDPEETHYIYDENSSEEPIPVGTFTVDSEGQKVFKIYKIGENGELEQDEEGNYVIDEDAKYTKDEEGYLCINGVRMVDEEGYLCINGIRMVDENGEPILVAEISIPTIPWHPHCFGEYHYIGENEDGVPQHEATCTYPGCKEKDVRDCEKETVLIDGYEVTRCKVCGHEFSSVDPKPVIESIEFSTDAEKNFNNIDLYKSDVTVTVKARCEAKGGATYTLEGFDENASEDVSFELTQDGDPDDEGFIKYSYTFSGSELYYSIDKVKGCTNDYDGSIYVERACQFEVNTTNMKVKGPVAYIEASNKAGDRVWIYDDDKFYFDNWYSSSIEGYPDTLELTFAAVTRNYDVSYFTVYDNGKELPAEAIHNLTEDVTGKLKNVEPVWDGNEVDYEYEYNTKPRAKDKQFYKIKYTCQIPTTVEGEHTYEIVYGKDSYHTESYEITIYVDNTVPVIDSISYNGNSTPVGSSGANTGYYNEDVEVEVVVTEENLVNEEKLDDLRLIEEGGGSKALTFKEKRGDKYVFSAVASSEGKYHVEGLVMDKADNIRKLANQDSFIIDKTNPEVTVEFDNTEAKNGKYYNAARVATITVKDANFEPDDKYITLNISEKDGKAAPGGWEKSSEGSYIKRINFDADGVYSFTVSCKDKAANASSTASAEEFVIDTTVPTIDVSFDNNSSSNEYYFKDARHATIVVEDANFDSKLVVIEKTGEDGAGSLPGVSGFSDADKKHSASMSFEKDGKYAFRVTCQDLAGNVADTYTSSVFVIDTLAPELNITGVADMSANNGVVQPIITTKDENLKAENVVVTLTGANKGTISTVGSTTQSNGGYVVEISDLPHVKSNDDLYILKAEITDLAGNVTEKEIKYSVNRFGSVYVLGDGTLGMIDSYYVTKPQNVVITEINVDELTYKEVSITYDGSVKDLSSGKDYTTTDTVNKNSWHSISYTINASNFRNDGLYSVSVYSEDKASNTQSNKSKDANIEFLVDSTAPSVIVSGVESDGVYQEAEHNFSVNATDTIGIAGLKVYLNNDVLAEYSAQELQENGGTEVITIPGKDDYQQLEIICSDVAGNETKLSCNNILVSEKAEDLIDNDIIQKIDVVPEEIVPVAGFFKKPIVWVVFASAASVLTAAGVFIFKKKRLK